MSWKTYVEKNLIGTQKVVKGAIAGLDGLDWSASGMVKYLFLIECNNKIILGISRGSEIFE